MSTTSGLTREAVITEVRRVLGDYPAVCAALLFGSWAEGSARSGSDVDVALLTGEGLSSADAFALSGAVAERLERALGSKIDVVLLTQASTSVARRALGGILLVERNPVVRALWAATILSRYHAERRWFQALEPAAIKRLMGEEAGMESLDREVILRRLLRLDRLRTRLERGAGASRERYLADEDLQAQVERRLQLAAQIAIDLANYLITHRRLEIPDEEENVFVVLGRAGILEPSLAERLKGLVRFRNILVHDYLTVDPGLVSDNLAARLDDFQASARQLTAHLERKSS
jgi:uncharacterized protein YutE (UPF0331/DUF86 family)/predicted nucleotidyltransferase